MIEWEKEYPLLSQINSPEDLKRLSVRDVYRLAEELRDVIIRVVAANGGHLAPNLGVVELTLALHRVFDSPRDRIIWDVGHQCYVHKIITGRREQFPTIRQAGGLSGFPKRRESVHDAFDTGHSSTSISAAVGMALARDLREEKFDVVAVIGDGALTGGMAFEALNHAGHQRTKIIVVLNDNEMSISENVGAVSAYLSRLRTDPMYYRSKDELEALLNRVPTIGKTVLKTLERIKDSFKYLVVPGMLFEELGFTYFGPIDGHNLEELEEVLKNARKAKEPVLVHVVTRKGKGYPPAEKNPDKFHGVGPFDIATGETPASAVPSYTDVFGETLVKLAEKDEDIVAITAAMPSGTGLNRFAARFPERFFDVGIAEEHAVTMAAGMAVEGLKPVVAIYSTFLQRAYDQILHDVCLQELPVVFALDRAGLVGEDGATHQGVFDFSYLRHIPNMIVMAPKDERELQDMLFTALSAQRPVAFRYPRGRGVGVELTDEPSLLPLGRGELLREGRDGVIVAVGNTVHPALEAAQVLDREGVTMAVINARFVKPLDRELILTWGTKTGLIVTVEENVLAGGFGSAVLELLEEEGIHLPVLRLGLPDRFIHHGPADMLRRQYCLTAEGIAEKVRERLVLEGKKRFSGYTG